MILLVMQVLKILLLVHSTQIVKLHANNIVKSVIFFNYLEGCNYIFSHVIKQPYPYSNVYSTFYNRIQAIAIPKPTQETCSVEYMNNHPGFLIFLEYALAEAKAEGKYGNSEALGVFSTFVKGCKKYISPPKNDGEVKTRAQAEKELTQKVNEVIKRYPQFHLTPQKAREWILYHYPDLNPDNYPSAERAPPIDDLQQNAIDPTNPVGDVTQDPTVKALNKGKAMDAHVHQG